MTDQTVGHQGPVCHEVEFRLSFGECDPAGIVYYATYLQWAERVHTEWWYLNGFRVDQLRAKTGASFVTRHVACDFHRSPEVMDLLRAQLFVGHVGNSSFSVEVRFADAESRVLLARQVLTLVFIDDARLRTSIPCPARALLAAGMV